MKFRGFFVRAIGLLTILSLAAILFSLIPRPQRLLQLGPTLVTFMYLAYVIMWRPYVELSDAGVVFRNVWQKVHIPWPSIKNVTSQWSLTITTATGEYSAWALPATATGAAPRLARDQANRQDAPAVARIIEERYQQLHDAGYLTSPAARRLQASVSVDWQSLIILAAAAGISILTYTLAAA